MGCPFSSDIGRRLLLLLQSNKQGVVQTGETFRAALTYCASDTELGVCPMCVVESPKIWVALLVSENIVLAVEFSNQLVDLVFLADFWGKFFGDF